MQSDLVTQEPVEEDMEGKVAVEEVSKLFALDPVDVDHVGATVQSRLN